MKRTNCAWLTPARETVLTLALCTLIAQPVLAEETTGENQSGVTTTLPTVTVEALRAPDASAVPNTVTIIEQEELDAQGAVTDDLSSVLGNLVPSFSPARQKMTSSGESLRGRSPLYMIDGVPQTNPLRDGSRDAHTIDPDLLQRVEVVNGSNAIQGLGAAGGIVNLQTYDAALSTDWHHKVKGRLIADDDFDSDGFGYKGVYIGGRKWDNTDMTVGATYYSRGLYFDGEDRPIGVDNTQGELADSDSRNIFFKGGYNLDANQRLQLMFNDYQLHGNGDYTLVNGDRSTGVPATSEPGKQEGSPAENDVTSVSLDYSHADMNDGELRAQAFYQDFAAMFGGGTFDTFQDTSIAPDGTLYDQSQNQSQKHGLKLSYSRDDLGISGLDFLGGVDYLEDTTKQVLAQTGREWVPESTFTSIAPFVQLNQDLLQGRLQLSGGLRHERAELKVDDYTSLASYGSQDVEGGSPDFSETLPNFGAVYHVGDDWSLYGSYAEGYSVADVGRVLRGIDQTNQSVEDFLTLEPVISDNRELGVDYDDGTIRLHAAYFWSDSDFGSRLENVGGVYEVRREKTEIEGLELTASRQLTDSVQIGAIYSRVRGEYDSNDDGNVDTDLGGINISPDRLNLFVAWDEYSALPVAGRLQVSQLMDRDFEGLDAPSDQDFDGHTLVDLSLAKRTSVGNFRLGVENLLDEQYITYYSQTATTLDSRYFAGRGRTLTLTYQNEF